MKLSVDNLDTICSSLKFRDYKEITFSSNHSGTHIHFRSEWLGKEMIQGRIKEDKMELEIIIRWEDET